MKINNIEFDIKNIRVDKNYNNIGYGNVNYRAPIYDIIKIDATIDNKYFFAFEKWIENSISSNKYKFDAIYNGLQLSGVFPIDYTFNQYNISVTLSADYFQGNLDLFNKQKLRREKLKEIEKKYPNK